MVSSGGQSGASGCGRVDTLDLEPMKFSVKAVASSVVNVANKRGRITSSSSLMWAAASVNQITSVKRKKKD